MILDKRVHQFYGIEEYEMLENNRFPRPTIK